MMMPANFSAVNAEMVYGGAVADYLPDVWTSKNVKTLSTNVLTILSNTFTGWAVRATLGTMFGGAWGDGADLFGSEGTLSGLFKYQRGANGQLTDVEMTGLNKFMTTLGVAASVYTLGTTGVKNLLNHDDVLTGIWGNIVKVDDDNWVIM